MEKSPSYESPVLTDYGQLTDITANDGAPQFVDVPQGTPVTGQQIIGSSTNLS